MRLTDVLRAQHLGWTFKKHWQIRGKRVPHCTGALKDLNKLKIRIKSVDDVITPAMKYNDCTVAIALKNEVNFNPNWSDPLCHVYDDNHVLIEGLPQALLLTKSVSVNGFPKSLEELIARSTNLEEAHTVIKGHILHSHFLDASQNKLPKITSSTRQGFNLARAYGTSHEKRSRLLINKLIAECEKTSGVLVNSTRRVTEQAEFNVAVYRNDNLLQLKTTAEKFITSTRPLQYVKKEYSADLPNLHPFKCTISIPKTRIFNTKTHYPLSTTISGSSPHTIIMDFYEKNVRNLHESLVNNSQIQSRSLLKSFATAVAYAKHIYGDHKSLRLPEPIPVQCIQTDGRTFHFGVFQLNTLELDSNDGRKNIWYTLPALELYTALDIRTDELKVEKYNKDVYRYVNAFYNNS